MIMFTAFIVGIFYCLDALHGERRDRSILFWKSLPVSDLTSVLSKAIVPLAILPLLTFAIIIATQFIMLLLSTVALLPSGLAGTTWQLLPWPQLSMILFYGLVTSALWEAPIFAWLLLVSSWARRATFLWAVLPWLAIARLRKSRSTRRISPSMLVRRLTGGFEEGFVVVKYPKGAHVPVVDRLTATRSAEIPQQPRPLDRAGHRRGFPRRRGPPPPLSRTALIHMHIQLTHSK